MKISRPHVKHYLPTIGLHALCWSLYISYEVLFDVIFPDEWQNQTNYTYFYVFYITFFYLHAHWALPKALKNKRHILWRLPLLFFLEFVFVLASLITIGMIEGGIELVTNSEEPIVFDIEGLEYFVIPIIPYLLYSTGYYFLRRYIREQQRTREAERLHFGQVIANKELENSLLQAKQDYLRAQVNPHLLYNTLSFVNHAAKHDPEQAEEAILMLSDLMRYALEYSPELNGMVPLHKEIEQAQNIIGINRLRFGDAANVALTMQGDIQQLKIIPLLLLTLVENVFKHGDFRNKEFPAKIEVRESGEHLILKTENKVADYKLPQPSSETGLANLAYRLRHFYGDAHRFYHGTEGDIFTVEVEVPLVVDGMPGELLAQNGV